MKFIKIHTCNRKTITYPILEDRRENAEFIAKIWSNLHQIMPILFYSDYRGKFCIEKVGKKNPLLCTHSSHCMQLVKHLRNLRLLRNVLLIQELHRARWQLRIDPLAQASTSTVYTAKQQHSLPEGWVMLLLESHALQAGIALTQLNFLCNNCNMTSCFLFVSFTHFRTMITLLSKLLYIIHANTDPYSQSYHYLLFPIHHSYVISS